MKYTHKSLKLLGKITKFDFRVSVCKRFLAERHRAFLRVRKARQSRSGTQLRRKSLRYM